MGLLGYFKDVFSDLVGSIKPQGIEKEYITKSLDELSGDIYGIGNPSKFVRDHNNNLGIFDTMMLDDDVSTAISMRKRVALSTPWDIVPKDKDNAQAEEIATFVKDMLTNIGIGVEPSFSDSLDNFLDALVYGYKVAEKIYGYYNVYDVPQSMRGKICLMKIKHAHSKHFDFDYDEYKNLSKLYLGYYYGNSQTVESIEQIEQKFSILTYPYAKDGSIYGESALIPAYKNWYNKSNLIKARNIYAEKNGFPLPVITYDQDMQNASSTKSMLVNLLKEKSFFNGLVIPGLRDKETNALISNVSVDIKDFGSKDGSNLFTQSIEDEGRRIQRAILLPDKVGGAETKGGLGQSGEQHLDIFMKLTADLHRMLEDVVNPMIRTIVSFNYGNTELCPRFAFQDIGQKVEATAAKALVDAGIVDPEEGWLRDYINIPQMSEKDRARKEEKDARKQEIAKELQLRNYYNGVNGGDKENVNAPAKEKEAAVDKDAFSERPAMPFKFEKVSKFYDMMEADFVNEYDSIHLAITQAIKKQIKGKWNDLTKDLKKVASIQVPKGDLKRLFERYYAKMYFTAKVDAIEEIKNRLSKVEKFSSRMAEQFEKPNFGSDGWLDREWLEKYLKTYGAIANLTKDDLAFIKMMKDKAFAITGIESETITNSVSTILLTDIPRGTLMEDVIAKVEDTLTKDRKKYSLTIARTNASDMYNNGRMNMFFSDDVDPYVEAYMYTAVIDGNTTEFCRLHDKQIIYKGDARFTSVTPPNHFNCRSTLMPIFIGEDEQRGNYFYDWKSDVDSKYFGAGISDALAQSPASGFGGISK